MIDRSPDSSAVVPVVRSLLRLLRVAVPLVLLLGTCAPRPERFETAIGGQVMGTTWSSKVVTASALPIETRKELHSLVLDALEDVNRRMSTWLDQSELSRFNASDSTEPFPLSRPTLEVIAEALEIGHASGGALDVTVGPLVDLWGFGTAPAPIHLPSDEELEQLRSHTGLDLLEVDLEAGTARKLHPELRVDLSAIAKGYAVDRAAEALADAGYESWLVEVGGELRVAGRNVDGGPWRLAIERPVRDQGRTLHRVIEVSDVALATSGDYRNWLEIEGRIVSHTLDPRSGRPITHGLASVSVLAERCSTADGWATALNVLGPEEGLRVAEEQRLPVLFLVHDDAGGVTERATSAWRQRLEEGEDLGGDATRD